MDNYISYWFKYDYFILDEIETKTVFEYKRGTPSTSYGTDNNTPSSHKSLFSPLPHESKALFQINNDHTDFLKMLPTLLDQFDKLENSLKTYYEISLSDTHQGKDAFEQICTANNLLKKMHPYFYDEHRRINYIIDNLCHYCRYMTRNRFTDFWYEKNFIYKGIIDSDVITDMTETSREKIKQSLLASGNEMKQIFQEKEAALCKRLFSPIYQLLEDIHLSQDQIEDRCNNIYKEYIMHISDKYLIPCINKDDYCKMKKYAADHKVMPLLNKLSHSISDYFSNASEIINAYPDIAVEQVYTLFLTHHYSLVEQFDNLNVRLSPQYIYDQCRVRLTKLCESKGQPHLFLFDETCFEEGTNNLYQRVIDNIEKGINEKLPLIKELNSIYPMELKKYMNTMLIDFQDFEQIILIEFLNILEKNYIIKKCPECGAYFITSSKKDQYCENHRGSHPVQQKNYMKRKLSAFPYAKTYNRYYNRLKQYIHRKSTPGQLESVSKQFENWNQSAKSINNHYKELSISDEASYTIELNRLCEKYGFPLPRPYRKST